MRYHKQKLYLLFDQKTETIFTIRSENRNYIYYSIRKQKLYLLFDQKTETIFTIQSDKEKPYFQTSDDKYTYHL